MLSVVYEATADLAPRQMVEITEDRGRVRIKLRAGTIAEDYIPPLNAALTELLSECTWYQIWRGQIISADSPDSPLTAEYVADPKVDLRACVQIREDRGEVRLHVNPKVPTEMLVHFLNPAVAKLLSGGQWFQLWQGEIVTMDDDSWGSAAA